jgi:large subunit ribosomal protein L4
MSNQNLSKTKIKSEQLKIVSAKDLNLEKKSEEISNAGYSVSIRALLQNWRQGTVGCKTRAEVSYSNKKPWKQKGTGRARAGSRKSPIWVGGGVIFGPQPRVRKLKVNKFLKRGLLNNLLSNLVENNKVFSLDFEVAERPKTSAVYETLKNVNLHEKKIIFLVEANDILSQSAFANIPNIRMVFFDELNTFNMTNGDILLLLKKDLNLFKDTVLKWI